jgi:hypothetical protein
MKIVMTEEISRSLHERARISFRGLWSEWNGLERSVLHRIHSPLS